MRTEVLRDTRLLDALEYIDDEYLASAARYKMKYAEQVHEHKITWRTPFKHWRQFVALVACLLLLSVASPLVSYIAEVIRDFNAGAGGGTTEEMLEDIVTDENGIPYTYPMFVEDLEPLTGEEMLMIDRLWIDKEYHNNYDDYYKMYIDKNYSESEASELADKRASIAKYRAKHNFFNDKYYWDSRYYGKINDCVVLVSVGMAAVMHKYEIAGYTISFSNSAVIYVVKDNMLFELEEAYDMGYLTDDHIGLISERNDAYNLYVHSYVNETQK